MFLGVGIARAGNHCPRARWQKLHQEAKMMQLSPEANLRVREAKKKAALAAVAEGPMTVCRRPPPSLSPHGSTQIYREFTPNLPTIPFIFNKVS
jgi:hypothetical protein